MKMPDIDKQAHFYSGMAVCFAVGLFTTPFIGMIVAIAAGMAKEAWDMGGHGTPDALDLIATSLGGFAAFLVFFAHSSLS